MNEIKKSWETDIKHRERFAFGRNWKAFLALVNDERIRTAEQSLKDMLEIDRLDGMRFLDAGSGSGLFSLAARRLGATVISFDYDAQSVACTAELKRRYLPGDDHWRIKQGSVLDDQFLSGLGQFDVVYSWGVLHHTGAMWDALAKVVRLVAPGGRLFISIYNDQGRASRIWTRLKRAYVRAPIGTKWMILLPAFLRLRGPRIIRDAFAGDPLQSWKAYARSGRGMDPWRDVIDWVGGYPFEVASPERIFDFCRNRDFELRRLKTCAGGRGCNEYVFVRPSAPVADLACRDNVNST